jgi:hypothetical protein
MINKALGVEFSAQRENRVYSLHFPYGAPADELVGAVEEILQEIKDVCEQEAQKAAAKDADAPKE